MYGFKNTNVAQNGKMAEWQDVGLQCVILQYDRT
jgi:hypothetical protein